MRKHTNLHMLDSDPNVEWDVNFNIYACLLVNYGKICW